MIAQLDHATREEIHASNAASHDTGAGFDAIAPQGRPIVRPTTDRQKLIDGIALIASDMEDSPKPDFLSIG